MAIPPLKQSQNVGSGTQGEAGGIYSHGYCYPLHPDSDSDCDSADCADFAAAAALVVVTVCPFERWLT